MCSCCTAIIIEREISSPIDDNSDDDRPLFLSNEPKTVICRPLELPVHFTDVFFWHVVLEGGEMCAHTLAHIRLPFVNAWLAYASTTSHLNDLSVLDILINQHGGFRHSL